MTTRTLSNRISFGFLRPCPPAFSFEIHAPQSGLTMAAATQEAARCKLLLLRFPLFGGFAYVTPKRWIRRSMPRGNFSPVSNYSFSVYNIYRPLAPLSNSPTEEVATVQRQRKIGAFPLLTTKIKTLKRWSKGADAIPEISPVQAALGVLLMQGPFQETIGSESCKIGIEK